MKRKLNVLVACEESGRVRDAFRELGHNAWSCDLQPCDPASKYAMYHHQGDVLRLLNRDVANMWCAANGWDLLIAHPPCTYLCNSGVCWLNHGWNKDRMKKMKAAARFFKLLLTANVPHKAIENPIPHRYGKLPKYNQIIQPWQFGHPERKATCLWLAGLPKLKQRDDAAIVEAHMLALPKAQQHRLHYLSPGPQRAKERSRTFSGIALAMARQWSEYILNES